MKKIEVKDYYAIKRGHERSKKLSIYERRKIAQVAAQKRWEIYRQENEEDAKFRKKITK